MSCRFSGIFLPRAGLFCSFGCLLFDFGLYLFGLDLLGFGIFGVWCSECGFCWFDSSGGFAMLG